MKIINKIVTQLKITKSKKIFNKLYNNINGVPLSKQDRGTVIKDDFSLVYGEVTFESFIKLLKLACPKRDEVFYDLGSGTGKAVIIAALTEYFSETVGIELLPSLYTTSLLVLKNFNKLNDNRGSAVKFINDNFLHCNILNANIVFINGTGFFEENLEQLINQLKTLKKGSRIIITSKQLNSPEFKLIHQDLHLMSWGWAQVSIYRVV